MDWNGLCKELTILKEEGKGDILKANNAKMKKVSE